MIWALVILCSICTATAQSFSFGDVAALAGVSRRMLPVVLDDFTNVQASPITTPRTATPGPGTWTVVQVDGTFATGNRTNVNEEFSAGTALTMTTQSAPNWGRLRIIEDTDTYYRTNLLAFIGKIRCESTSGGQTLAMGFERPTISFNPDSAAYSPGGPAVGGLFDGVGYNTGYSVSRNQNYEVAVILRKPVGSYLFIRGGNEVNLYTNSIIQSSFRDWTLAWVDNASADATVRPVFDSYDYVGSLSRFKVVPMDQLWADPYHLVLQRKPTTVNNDTATMHTNSFVEHTITAATGVTQELRIRVTNSTNKWIIRMDQGAGTIKLVELNAGTETDRSTNTMTWTNGSQYRVAALCYDTTITVNVGTLKKLFYIAATNSMSGTGVEVSDAGSELVTWQGTPAIPAYVAYKPKLVFPFGDSKTAGVGDTNVPGETKGGWPPYFVDSMSQQTISAMECPLRVGRIGYSVLDLKNVVDSELALRYGTPDYVCVNVGANDCNTTIDATFDSNYGYILDAIHTKWPNAKVYLMQIWERSPCTGLSAIRSHAISIAAARSSWCFMGPDEAVFLENGDNGTTYTTDGIHPTHAGYELTAQQWRNSLGL